MQLLRLWNTVRYLSLEQLLFRVLRRLKRTLMRYFPVSSRKHFECEANDLPIPNIDSLELLAIAESVLRLQRIVYGKNPSGVRVGQFTLLNQNFEFGNIETICWRGDFREGKNPLRRMNLAYLGYIVPLLAQGKEGDLDVVCRLLEGLEKQNAWSASGVFGDVWHLSLIHI